MENHTASEWESLTDEELRRAAELLVRPEWLRERPVLVAVLETLDFNAQDAKEQLQKSEPLNDGPMLSL